MINFEIIYDKIHNLLNDKSSKVRSKAIKGLYLLSKWKMNFINKINHFCKILSYYVLSSCSSESSYSSDSSYSSEFSLS